MASCFYDGSSPDPNTVHNATILPSYTVGNNQSLEGPSTLFLEIAIFCNLMSPEIVYFRSDFIILLLFSKVPLTATEDGNQIKCKPASGIVYTMGFCKMAEMTAAAETVLL